MRSRRRFLVEATAAGAATLVSRGVWAGEQDPSATSRHLQGAEGAGVEGAKPEQADPSVLILGDSMIAGGFGVFLERALKKEHGYKTIRRRGKSSSGLARPDFFDWMKEAKALVAKKKPDINVVMFGGNDVQGLYMGKGKWIRWHEQGWQEEYVARITALCEIIAPEGQQIFWVGLPIMRPNKFRGRVERVNTIYRAEMAIRPGATFVDTWSLLANTKGEYSDRIYLQPEFDEAGNPVKRKRKRVRAGDGIHLSPAGAHHLKAHVLDELLPALSSFGQK